MNEQTHFISCTCAPLCMHSSCCVECLGFLRSADDVASALVHAFVLRHDLSIPSRILPHALLTFRLKCSSGSRDHLSSHPSPSPYVRPFGQFAPSAHECRLRIGLTSFMPATWAPAERPAWGGAALSVEGSLDRLWANGAPPTANPT